MKAKRTFFFMTAIFTAVLNTGAAVHYVKQGGTGNGSSWATASGDLQAVINAAASLDKIFVAAGTYIPAEGTSFTLGGKVLSIYGGFVGNETSTTPPSIPDTINNKTIFQGNGNRVFHAYYTATAGDGKVDDNLTIQGCRIQGGTVAAPGGGLYIKTGAISYCTITDNTSTNNHGGGVWFEKCTLKNSIITGNTAGSDGGGVYSYVSITLNDCELSYNTAQKGGGIFSHNVAKINTARIEYNKTLATGGGGGMYAQGSSDQSTIENCIISNNISEGQAGGIFLGVKTKLLNSTVKSNKAVFDGGGIRADSENKVEITGCIISDNETTSGAGGGVALNKSTLSNCLIAGNKAGGSGGGIRLSGASSATGLKSYSYNNTVVNNSSSNGGGISANNNGVFKNCIVWNNSTNGQSGDVNGGAGTYSLFREASTTDGNSNLNANPLFRDAANDDFRLSQGSPAIDSGNALDITITTDLLGGARTVGTAIDMGAYEYTPTNSVIFSEDMQRKIWSRGKTLYVQSDKAGLLSVYTVSGALYRQTITEYHTAISLPRGLYIVKFDNRTCKITIQ
jgi:hypothetical protein